MNRIFIKAKIKKTRTTENTKFKYPAAWNSEKIHVVAYQDNPDNLGDVEEFCIGVVTPEAWEKMKNDPDITQVTPVEANEDGKKWKPKTTKVLDQDAVILALATPEADRTKKQKDSLDPKHIEPGINEGEDFDIRKFVAPGQILENLTERELTSDSGQDE